MIPGEVGVALNPKTFPCIRSVIQEPLALSWALGLFTKTVGASLARVRHRITMNFSLNDLVRIVQKGLKHLCALHQNCTVFT